MLNSRNIIRKKEDLKKLNFLKFTMYDLSLNSICNNYEINSIFIAKQFKFNLFLSSQLIGIVKAILW